MSSHFERPFTTVLIVCMLLSMSSPGMSAEIYKWKDKDGKVFFSDTPPPSDVDTEVKQFKQEAVPKARNDTTVSFSPTPKELLKLKWTPAQMDYTRQLKANLTPSELFEQASPSVWIVISAPSEIAAPYAANLKNRLHELALGSAVAVTENRLLTNYHLIAQRPYVIVKHEERFEKATIISGDMQTDRCVLYVPNGGLKPVKGTKNYNNLTIGETVYTIGSPNGLENTLGQGIISGKRKSRELKLIQTTAQISKGSSGGGLFDNSGNLIGVTTFKLIDSDSLNFAIAVDNFTE